MRDPFKIASSLKASIPEIRVRFGVVVSVETGRTATIRVGGSTESVAGIPYVESMCPQPGKPVILLTDGVDMFILDHVSDASMSLSPRAYRTSDQTITTATDTAVTWSAADSDPWSCWSAGTPTRLTAPLDGRYMAVGYAQFAASTTGIRGVWISDGSSNVLARSQVSASSADPTYLSVVTPAFTLAKSGYITMSVRQTSGGNLALTRVTSYSPALSLIYLG